MKARLVKQTTLLDRPAPPSQTVSPLPPFATVVAARQQARRADMCSTARANFAALFKANTATKGKQ